MVSAKNTVTQCLKKQHGNKVVTKLVVTKLVARGEQKKLNKPEQADHSRQKLAWAKISDCTKPDFLISYHADHFSFSTNVSNSNPADHLIVGASRKMILQYFQ